MTNSSHHAAELMRAGYVVVRGAVDRSRIMELDADLDVCFAATPFCDGDFYGRATKRFGSMLLRSRHAEGFVRHPLALALADHALGPWCDRINLNLTQAVEIHPGALAQYPHRDQDMWDGPKGKLEYLVNVMWPLTPFTRENGATRLWPRSGGGIGEPMAPVDEAAAIYPEMEPGDVLVFLGSTLHAGGANLSAASRRGLIISYCLGWLKPFENQWLIYPPEVARHFDPELAALIGYAQHRPNLGNVEGQCPSRLLWGDGDGLVAATDALREDQAAALRDYVARQEAEKAAAGAGLLGG